MHSNKISIRSTNKTKTATPIKTATTKQRKRKKNCFNIFNLNLKKNWYQPVNRRYHPYANFILTLLSTAINVGNAKHSYNYQQ